MGRTTPTLALVHLGKNRGVRVLCTTGQTCPRKPSPSNCLLEPKSLSLAKFYPSFRSSLVTTSVEHLPWSLQVSVHCSFSMLLCPLSHTPPADGTESSVFSVCWFRAGILPILFTVDSLCPAQSSLSVGWMGGQTSRQMRKQTQPHS